MWNCGRQTGRGMRVISAATGSDVNNSNPKCLRILCDVSHPCFLQKPCLNTECMTILGELLISRIPKASRVDREVKGQYCFLRSF